MSDSASTIQAHNKQTVIGVILVISAALLYSAKAIFAKLAYHYPHVDATIFLTLRMGFSFPFYVVIALWTSLKALPSEALSKKDFLIISLLGLLGFYLAGLLDLIGLQYISASLERLILFLYPTLVVLFSWILFKQKISKRNAIALSLSYLGICVVFMNDLDNLKTNSEFIWGAVTIFLSAVSFAIYIIGSGKVIAKFKPMRFTAYAMITSCVFTMIQYILTVSDIQIIFKLDPNVYYLSLAMSFGATVLPSLLFAEGMMRIGSSNAAMLNTIGPVSTIYLAYAFLGEQLSMIDILGSCLVFIGVLLINPKKAKENANEPPAIIDESIAELDIDVDETSKDEKVLSRS